MDELIGRRVVIYLDCSDELEATVIGVRESGMIRVRLDGGEILTGNQWEEIG